MIQDIKTAKKDNFCGICRYCLYEDYAGGFLCHNQNSIMYGEYISDIGHEDCDKWQGHKYATMSLKDACKIITQKGQPYHFLGLPEGKTRPFYAVTFKNNDDALDWKDALTRLFGEYMDLAEKDGDFNE